jgi:hypothetical protein
VGYLGNVDGAADILVVLGLTYGSVSAARSTKDKRRKKKRQKNEQLK